MFTAVSHRVYMLTVAAVQKLLFTSPALISVSDSVYDSTQIVVSTISMHELTIYCIAVRIQEPSRIPLPKERASNRRRLHNINQ